MDIITKFGEIQVASRKEVLDQIREGKRIKFPCKVTSTEREFEYYISCKKSEGFQLFEADGTAAKYWANSEATSYDSFEELEDSFRSTAREYIDRLVEEQPTSIMIFQAYILKTFLMLLEEAERLNRVIGKEVFEIL